MPRPRSDVNPSRDEGAPGARERPLGLSSIQAQSLHARLAARDELALAELIALATPWLLGLLQALLRDPDEIEEVLQETFTIVWNRIGRVPTDPRGLMAWVLRVARNRAIDRLRSHRRQVRKSERLRARRDDSDAFAEPAEPNEASTPGWHVHRTVHNALETLPQEQLVVVHLAYFEGLTHSELAARLGIPIGTVKTRLRLAIDKLRPTLEAMKDWIV